MKKTICYMYIMIGIIGFLFLFGSIIALFFRKDIIYILFAIIIVSCSIIWNSTVGIIDISTT